MATSILPDAPSYGSPCGLPPPLLGWKLAAWVDTGFTGELVLPQDTIATLGFPRSAVVKAELGDGSETVLDVYTCLISWFGRMQQIEVIAANTGKLPLLGVGLLQGHTLTIDYASRTLTIV